MQINPLAAQPNLQQNMTAEAAQAAASSASFDSMLQEAKRASQLAKNAAAAGDSAAAAAKEDKALKEACKGFEAMFLNMMYREMRQTVHEGGLFGESNAMKIFEDMRDSEMAKQMAEAGGIGLGDMLYRQLAPQATKRAQAEAQTAAAVLEQQKQQNHNG
ncbi:rod-binding protein [uncultured Selenomonas sp.]|jgi:flagellar protein FlgJ|uniref:rod-binding protein n=1 Tax=uncultured Selenomonas sp. TaxID=159275 RepID=UPI0025D9B7BC|nr:rod-binding protein [uncultured Selenomonas sp.]